MASKNQKMKDMKKAGEQLKKQGIIAITISMMGKPKKKKAEMAYGGSVKGKKHMYAAGGSVTDNPGLKALRASGAGGMEAYKKITGKND